MIALVTMGCVLLPILAVSAVLAWAESRARRGKTTVAEPPLTSALLAATPPPLEPTKAPGRSAVGPPSQL